MYIYIFNLDGYLINMTIEEIIDNKCIKMIKLLQKITRGIYIKLLMTIEKLLRIVIRKNLK